MTGEIKLKKRRAFSSVPDDILIDMKLSDRAARILGWLVGRPPDWIFFVKNIRLTFRLSEEQWKKVRRELEAAGYFTQERIRNEATGKIEWENTVSDEAKPQKPSPSKPSPGRPLDGQPEDGKQGGIAAKKPKGFFKQQSKENHTAAARKRYGVLIENEEDSKRLDALLNKHGVKVVEQAAETTTAEGNRPYVSNISKLLKTSSMENRYEESNTAPISSESRTPSFNPFAELEKIQLEALQPGGCGNTLDGTASRCGKHSGSHQGR